MMGLLEELIQKKLLSLLAILLIGFHYYNEMDHRSRWEELKGFQSDAIGYYVYLPATFIYQDLKYQYADKVNQEYPGRWFVQYSEDDQGNRFQKYPIGTALMEAPFFLIAHFTALNTNHKADGYSEIYHRWIAYSSLTYAVLALFMIAQIIGLYFSDVVSTIAIVFIGLGTNFFYYATVGTGYSHIPGLFLLGIYFYSVIKWFRGYRFQHLFALAVSLSLATIIRPTNILFAFFFVLLLFEKKIALKTVFDHLKRYKYKWVPLILCALLAPTLQMFLWKYNSGSWVQYSYGDEGFFFTQPHVFYGLFSARNGLFLYSLPFLLSIIGLLIWNKKLPNLSIFFTLGIFYYVIYSWWCWWYGGSYGSRAGIESYILLGVLLGACINFIIHNFHPTLAVLFFISIFYSTSKMTSRFVELSLPNLIHYDSMTWEAYKYALLNDEIGQDYFELWEQPDYEGSLKNGREYVGFQELNPRNKYSEAIDTVFSKEKYIDSLQLNFQFWGPNSFIGDQVVFLEVVCEEVDYFRSYPVKPEINRNEWNSGKIRVPIDSSCINQSIQFRLIYEGKRRLFYRPIGLVYK